MFNKSEKRYLLPKIIVAVLVIFFAVMAFIQPKPFVEQVEKPYVVGANAN